MSGRGKFYDITGKKYNMLTVIKQVPRPQYVSDTGAWWLVRCDCGKKKIIRGNSLRTKNTKSCGCSTGKLMRESRLLEIGLSQKRTVYKYYETHAKKLNKNFKLSFNKFIILAQQECYYCGKEPKNIAKSNNNSGDFIYNGIDRKNNSLGYTIENSVPCCKICNIAKNKHSEKDFYDWIKKVYEKRFIPRH